MSPYSSPMGCIMRKLARVSPSRTLPTSWQYALWFLRLAVTRIKLAALLHDAVEDQGGLPTLETIRQLLGERVAKAVESCSDSIASDPKKKLPWRERKEKYLAHLRSANRDALMISAADKLHNARAILSDYRERGESLLSRFNAPKEDQLWYYGELVEALRQAPAPKLIVGELSRVVEELNRAVEERKRLAK